MAKEEIKEEKENLEKENLEKENLEKYNLVELSTQTGVFVKDSDGIVYDEKAMLCKILNELAKLRKALG